MYPGEVQKKPYGELYDLAKDPQNNVIYGKKQMVIR